MPLIAAASASAAWRRGRGTGVGTAGRRRPDPRSDRRGSTAPPAVAASVTTAIPVTGDRPGSPSNAAGEATPRRGRRAPPPSRPRRCSRPPRPRAAGAPRSTARCAALGPRASARRSSKVRNSRKLNSRLTSAGSGCIASSPGMSIGASRRSTVTSWFLRTRCLVLGERRPELRRQLVEVGEHAVEPAVGRDQLGGGLLPHPGNAGQVVARVAAQRGVLGVLRRRDAGAVEDAGLVVEHVVADTAAVVEHLDVRVAHELVGVAVAGDDHDVVAALDGLFGGGGDQVVGLVAGQLDHRHAERRRAPRAPTPSAGAARRAPPRAWAL